MFCNHYPVADPDLRIRGGGALIQTQRWGEGRPQENSFRPLGPHFGLKIKGGRAPPGPYPGSATATSLIDQGQYGLNKKVGWPFC